ncbi:MAG TPA: universal stress protein, partial [Candidatus Binataceae bacterium]|nr:universal stress protein [Candidatus Binataceae bacterium]
KSGWPGKVIESVADEVQADLIVMARKGWGGTSRGLSGVAEHVIRAAKCPVLSLPYETPFEGLRRILCPLDFDSNSATALSCAGRMAQEYGADLILLHVIPESEEVFSAPTTSQSDLDAVARIMNAADQNLGTRSGFEVLIRRGNPAQEILAIEKQRKPDLIVMATHGRTGLSYLFLGSVVIRVVRESETAILTVQTRSR